jgi:predicted Ser/Thr protein kinase
VCPMERQFSVEAKAFSFSVVSGKPVLRLEERRKGFRGFILLGVKASVWLADTVEEALETQRREDFASSICDEVRVLKVRMGRNRAGCFLEAAVFVEGSRKGVIRLPKGRGGWGW